VRCLYFIENITPSKVKSTVKHSAAYKLNQQINGKEAEVKKRKDCRITFEMAYSAC